MHLPRGRNWFGVCALWFMIGAATITAQNATSPSQPSQNDSGQAQGFKIAGTVVNAVTGAPLERATVSIASTVARNQRIAMVTAASGHFEFNSVPAGKYSLQGARQGYLASSYEQHEQYSTAIVTGPQFVTDELVLRLMPMGLIMGHVLNESGEPARGAVAHLYTESHNGGITRVTRAAQPAIADDRGYFDFPLVRPGRYFVSVSATPWYAVHPVTEQNGDDSERAAFAALDMAYPTTYYGGATESENAAPIDLKGGEKEDIEIRLSPMPALHFIVRVPMDASGPTPGRDNVFRIPMLQKRVFDWVEPVNPGGVQPVGPGVYEVAGVSGGHYELSFRSNDPDELARFTEISLDRDGQDLNLAQSPMLAKVTVQLEAEEPLAKDYAVSLRDERHRVVAFAQGDATRRVSFPAVKPGKYDLVVAGAGKFYCVTRTTSDGEETIGHGVNVPSGGSVDLKAQVVEGVAGIEGAVQKNGKPIAGVMVALIPKDPERNLELFRRDQSDFDGTFLLHGVIPGTYTVVAVEDAWGFDWMNAGVLARYVQHGQTVTIGEGMKATMHLREAVEVQAR
jgi:Carboxypeptidase regulatory-like domain